jgi:hypothetical protein
MKNIKQKELFITTILEDFLCADKYDREKVEEPNVAYVRDCLEREVSAMVEHGLIETKFTIDDYLAAFTKWKTYSQRWYCPMFISTHETKSYSYFI